MTIRAECFTNIDAYKREDWPMTFVAVPRKGERVRSKGGKTLQVVEVTHCGGSYGGEEPYVRVELHK